MTDYPDALVEFLHELDGWERAYPLSAFPEPDLERAAELLKAGGMTLGSVSASNMRHVISCIAPKARAVIPIIRNAAMEEGFEAGWAAMQINRDREGNLWAIKEKFKRDFLANLAKETDQ